MTVMVPGDIEGQFLYFYYPYLHCVCNQFMYTDGSSHLIMYYCNTNSFISTDGNSSASTNATFSSF